MENEYDSFDMSKYKGDIDLINFPLLTSDSDRKVKGIDDSLLDIAWM